MKNPIGKFRREKLEEINFKVDSFIEEFNSIKENMVLLETIQNDLSTFKEDFEQIKEVLFYEPSEEELKEQEKAAQEQAAQMKLLIRAAISDMLADEKNQEAIKDFVSQFTGAGKSGQFAGMAYDNFVDADGNPDWIKAIFTWFSQQGQKGKSTAPIASGKRGAY